MSGLLFVFVQAQICLLVAAGLKGGSRHCSRKTAALESKLGKFQAEWSIVNNCSLGW